MWDVVSCPDPTLEEGKGSGELWQNPRFLLYGTCQQGHAKLGSDWLLWLHLRVIATGGKANLEPDWSAKFNSLYSYTAIQRCYIPAVSLSCDWARAAISLARGNSSVQAQGFYPSSPDPFPPLRWGLGTRLCGSRIRESHKISLKDHAHGIDYHRWDEAGTPD